MPTENDCQRSSTHDTFLSNDRDGDNIPGLAELKAGFAQIDIRYTALANGGEIRYTTRNPSLVMALHHWFRAQVSDYGRHAVDHE